MSLMLVTLELFYPQIVECAYMSFLKIIDLMKKVSSTEFKRTEVKFTKHKHFKMCQLQTNTELSLAHRDRCCLDLTEFSLEG